MRTQVLFPTLVYQARLRLRGWRRLNARRLQLDLTARALTMTDCWVNVMGRGAVHGLHLHPLSTISGTYYVAVPEGSPGLKFEDPRTSAPAILRAPRHSRCR